MATLAFTYEVPKKDGTYQERMVLNPCSHRRYIGRETELLNHWLSTMPEGVEALATKRRNTIVFLENLQSHVERSVDMLSEAMERAEKAGVFDILDFLSTDAPDG
jgi:hypothetical protein